MKGGWCYGECHHGVISFHVLQQHHRIPQPQSGRWGGGGFWFGAAAVRLPPLREIPGGIAAKSPANPARSRLIFNESTVSFQVPVMTALNVCERVRLVLQNSAPYGWPQGSSYSPSPPAWQHAARLRRGDYLRRLACQTRGTCEGESVTRCSAETQEWVFTVWDCCGVNSSFWVNTVYLIV